MDVRAQHLSPSFLSAIATIDDAVLAAVVPVGNTVDSAGVFSNGFGSALPAWVDCMSGSLALTGVCGSVTIGDIMAAANDLVLSFGGRIVDCSLHAGDGVPVCAFGVAFEHDGEVCLGTVGFSPISDGTVSVLAVACGADTAVVCGPVRGGFARHGQAAA